MTEPTIDSRIPVDLHPAVRVARREWREMNKGMELDGTADVIVLALANEGLLIRPANGQRRL